MCKLRRFAHSRCRMSEIHRLNVHQPVPGKEEGEPLSGWRHPRSNDQKAEVGRGHAALISGWVCAFRRVGRCCQAAVADNLTRGSSLNGAMVFQGHVARPPVCRRASDPPATASKAGRVPKLPLVRRLLRTVTAPRWRGRDASQVPSPGLCGKRHLGG